MGGLDPLADQPDHVGVNRELWTRTNASYTDTEAAAKWGRDEIAWGLWDTPERDVRVLPDVASRDVIELGCGTAYFSAWLRRRGARRAVGVDVTPAQLETARRLDGEWALGLELIEADAEAIPLPDASFDLAVSEYGASIWRDPDRWIPEAARLLRPGGELVFMRNSTLSMLCHQDSGEVSDRLQRPQRSLSRLEWTGDGAGVEFHPAHGDLLRLLRRSGFEVLDLVEIFASERSTDHPFYSHVTADWARSWPGEEIWRARRLLF